MRSRKTVKAGTNMKNFRHLYLLHTDNYTYSFHLDRQMPMMELMNRAFYSVAVQSSFLI